MNEVKKKIIEALECAIDAVKGLPDIIENSRFKVLNDGWIQDKDLGIDWGPSSEKTMNHEKAEKWSKDKGGRLPTIEELRSIVDYERHEPAIDVDIFKDTKSSWYWTNTPAAGYPEFAWCVDISGGGVGSGSKGNGKYVRPVRKSKGVK